MVSSPSNSIHNDEDVDSSTCPSGDDEDYTVAGVVVAPPLSSASRILFGSCNSQHHKQPLWPHVISRNATAFVWGGDAVYADDRVLVQGQGWWWWRPRRIMEASPSYLASLYKQQQLVDGYKALLDTGISIFGTIDDHDYGINNGDKTYKWKKESGIEFVKFLGLSNNNNNNEEDDDDDESSAMAQRAAKGLGVYGVQLFDFSRPHGQRLLSDKEAGLDPDVTSPQPDLRKGGSSSENQLVAIFCLDVRTHKSPWRSSNNSKLQERLFVPDTEGDFLGETQWEWFEQAIGRSQAAVNIVVTGLQVHTHVGAGLIWDGNIVEGWSKFPRAQHRLYQALLQANVQAPLLITGDVHLAQMLRKDCRRPQPEQIIKSIAADNNTYTTRPIMEVTTSGMTHSWGSSCVCGRPNLNPLCRISYFSIIFRPVVVFFHWVYPWTELVLDDDDGGNNKKQYSLDLNFAEVDLDWNNRVMTVRVLGIELEGSPLLERRWHLDELSGKTPMTMPTSDTIGLLEREQEQARHFQMVEEQLQAQSLIGSDQQDWICVNNRGVPNPIQAAFGIVSTCILLLVLGLLPCLLPTSACLVFRRHRRYPKRMQIK
jgi:hypothetical protein